MESKDPQSNIPDNGDYKVAHSLIEFLVVLVRSRWFLLIFIIMLQCNHAILATKWYKASALFYLLKKQISWDRLEGFLPWLKDFLPAKV